LALPNQSTDYYFVLEGILSITTREPEEKTRRIRIGGNYEITPDTAHLVVNDSFADCRFLLLQGVGAFDWFKTD
jgi:hypothetical protein